jgi:phage shock protein C
MTEQPHEAPQPQHPSSQQAPHQQPPHQQPPHQQPPYQQPPYQQGPYQQGPAPAAYRRLTRTSWDSPISGVCGGLAWYAGVDPTLVRVLAVVAAFFTFPIGPIVYLVLWAVIPKE